MYDYFKARKINLQRIMSIMVLVRIKWGAHRWWLYWQKTNPIVEFLNFEKIFLIKFGVYFQVPGEEELVSKT